jgi:hypothetical protein
MAPGRHSPGARAACNDFIYPETAPPRQVRGGALQLEHQHIIGAGFRSPVGYGLLNLGVGDKTDAARPLAETDAVLSIHSAGACPRGIGKHLLSRSMENGEIRKFFLHGSSPFKWLFGFDPARRAPRA